MSRRRVERTRALGVVVPVHDEEALLGDALRALGEAVDGVRDPTIPVHVVIVLDACHDASASIARSWEASRLGHRSLAVSIVPCEANNVGVARQSGCSFLLEHWREFNLATTWIATTDADSRVPKSWLRAQMRHHDAGVDVWAGRVAVADYSFSRRESVSRWQRAYDVESQPIHGASLGFNGARFVQAGGFAPLEAGEDRALIHSLLASGATVHFDSSLQVLTSARRRARAPHGFAEALGRFDTILGAVTD